MTNNLPKIIQLCEQLLARAKADDIVHKKEMLRQHKGEKAIGDSFMVFYLNVLLEELKKIPHEPAPPVPKNPPIKFERPFNIRGAKII